MFGTGRSVWVLCFSECGNLGGRGSLVSRIFVSIYSAVVWMPILRDMSQSCSPCGLLANWCIPVLGGSHFCGNRRVPVLTSCYENLIGSLIYLYFGRGNRPEFFSKFTWFSIKGVLVAYIIKVGFQIQFSHPSSPIFQKLEFNLILN